jgi:hypothetical protein
MNSHFRVRRGPTGHSLHVANLGGPDTISAAQYSLCQRASTLEVQIEPLEAAMSVGESVDLDLFGRLAGHLRRYHETLGLERRTRPVEESEIVSHFRRGSGRRRGP